MLSRDPGGSTSRPTFKGVNFNILFGKLFVSDDEKKKNMEVLVR